MGDYKFEVVQSAVIDLLYDSLIVHPKFFHYILNIIPAIYG